MREEEDENCAVISLITSSLGISKRHIKFICGADPVPYALADRLVGRTRALHMDIDGVPTAVPVAAFGNCLSGSTAASGRAADMIGSCATPASPDISVLNHAAKFRPRPYFMPSPPPVMKAAAAVLVGGMAGPIAVEERAGKTHQPIASRCPPGRGASACWPARRII